MSTIAFLSTAFGKRLALGLNKPGTFTCSVPLLSEVGLKANNHSTCIIAERGGKVVWSGPIQNISTDVDAGRVNITANGWFEELNGRILRISQEASATYTNVADWLIAKNLVLLANAQTDSNGTVRPTHIKTVTGSDSTHLGGSSYLRTRSYKRFQNIGAAIMELTQIESGLDIIIDPVSRKFNTQGWDYASDWVNTHYVSGVHPYNAKGLQVIEDGLRTRNSFAVTGAQGITAYVDSPDAMNASTVMIEGQESLSDVADLNILAAYGNAELVYRSNSPLTISFTPVSQGDGDLIYRPWDDYNLGGTIYLTCETGRVNLKRQPVRVFGFTVSITDNGDEVIEEIQTSYSA